MGHYWWLSYYVHVYYNVYWQHFSSGSQLRCYFLQIIAMFINKFYDILLQYKSSIYYKRNTWWDFDSPNIRKEHKESFCHFFDIIGNEMEHWFVYQISFFNHRLNQNSIYDESIILINNMQLLLNFLRLHKNCSSVRIICTFYKFQKMATFFELGCYSLCIGLLHL